MVRGLLEWEKWVHHIEHSFPFVLFDLTCSRTISMPILQWYNPDISQIVRLESGWDFVECRSCSLVVVSIWDTTLDRVNLPVGM
jgi:hypothetical protein